jgi:hypothetical protein
MSAALDIASVSAALTAIIADEISPPRIASAFHTPPTVVVGSPRSSESHPAEAGPALRLLLYRVVENTALRNIEPSARDVGARSLHRARLTLDLHYLLFAEGCTGTQSEVLLGAALAALHATPVLTRHAPNVAQHADEASRSAAVHDSSLSVALTSLSLTELTMLWAALQAPLRASATFVVSGLTVDSDDYR